MAKLLAANCDNGRSLKKYFGREISVYDFNEELAPVDNVLIFLGEGAG